MNKEGAERKRLNKERTDVEEQAKERKQKEMIEKVIYPFT